MRKKIVQRVLYLIVSCKYGDIIADPELLNKEAISKLGKRDIKLVKLLLSKKLYHKGAIAHMCSLIP